MIISYKYQSRSAVSHIQNFGDLLGDAASPAGDEAPTPGRCGFLPLEMYHLLERCTSPTPDAASPECGCRVSRWRCRISTGDLQNSGYVTLLFN